MEVFSLNWGAAPIAALTGAKACTAVCSGSVKAKATSTTKCGGAGSKTFNLYVEAGAAVPTAAVTKKA